MMGGDSICASKKTNDGVLHSPELASCHNLYAVYSVDAAHNDNVQGRIRANRTTIYKEQRGDRMCYTTLDTVWAHA